MCGGGSDSGGNQWYACKQSHHMSVANESHAITTYQQEGNRMHLLSDWEVVAYVGTHYIATLYIAGNIGILP